MKVEVRRHPDHPYLYDLWVDNQLIIEEETFPICDQVRAALNGELWPLREMHEVAEMIRKNHDRPSS